MSVVTQAQKEALYQDGFVVLPGLIPAQRVAAARRAVFVSVGRLRADALALGRDGDAAKAKQAAESTSLARGGPSRSPKPKAPMTGAGADGVFMDLLHATPLVAVVHELIGEALPVRDCQLPTTFPTDPEDHINESGYTDRETPFHGWHGHLDGLWNGATAMHQRTDRRMTDAESKAWFQDPSRNGCQRAFPEHAANVKNFTALVALALSDQTEEGSGNLGLLKGAHHEMERFFRRQRDAGGPLGPDGPGWPRIDTSAPNGGGLRHYPDAVREAFAESGTTTTDGKSWPRPTLLKMALGDAAIVLHAVPHSATRVEGTEPRLMAYFRVTSAARPEANRHVCPNALCDIWSEWPGMADVVGAHRAGSRKD